MSDDRMTELHVEILRLRLERALEQRRLGKMAKEVGVPLPRLSELIHGKRRFTPYWINKLGVLIK